MQTRIMLLMKVFDKGLLQTNSSKNVDWKIADASKLTHFIIVL